MRWIDNELTRSLARQFLLHKLLNFAPFEMNAALRHRLS